MTDREMMELLREACGCACKKDMRGYQRRMERADAAIMRGGDNDALRGEYVVASAFACGRDWRKLRGIYKEALGLLRGPSRLFPRGCHLFSDYYNVFAICNVEPGAAGENADVLSETVSLFDALTGGGKGTDICYRAQHAYYRGDIDAALPLAKEAFDTAEASGQGLVALCAAETLTGIAKHRQDIGLWRFAAGYINAVAEGSAKTSRACREQAELLGYMQELSLGFLHSVPDWIKNGAFGAVPTPWGYEQKEDALLAGSLPNALLVQLQYSSYSGDPVRALLIADAMQKVYRMSDVILNVYLDFFRAGCYLQLNDDERVRESLTNAVRLLAMDGLWLIAAEFAPAFGGTLYEIVDTIDASGTRRIREIGADYWEKLIPFRDAILRDASIGLTKREKEVAALLLGGKTNAEIARQLSISERTVKGHVTHIFHKYNILRRSQLHGAVETIREARLADWTKLD